MVVPNNASVFLQTLIYVMNQSSIQQETAYTWYYLDIGKQTNVTKCYGIYGCFELTPPWTSEHRPVSLFPEDLKKIEPKYPFFTRQHPTQPKFIDLNEFDIVLATGIDPDKPVYLISHGYMEGGGIAWISEMAQELLKMDDCTVIVVDWQGGSSPPYTQAVANIRLVGAMTAYLLGDLARHTGSKRLDHVHCIGHSLGAHLSGYVGYTLQKLFNITLGRITGLDPAEPHFAKARPPVRLDRSAAKYVDIVHTDASQFIRGGLGITERIGHVDYYPNGGTDQPGCGKSVVQYINDEKGSFFRGIRKYLGCNHIRSYEFFIESINPKCTFMTMACESYDDFISGRCFNCGHRGQKCLTFGYHGRKHYQRLIHNRIISPEQSLVQYFKTGDRKPFCRAHYRVTVTISNTAESQEHGGEIGQLYFTFHSTSDGSGPKTEPVPLNDGGYHAPGQTYMGVVASDEITDLRAIEVEWKFESSPFNPLTWRILTTPQIYIENITVDSMEIQQRIVVCPKDGKPLLNFVPYFMISAYC